MKRKRLFALALSAVLAGSVLAGCGGNEKPEKGETNNGTVATVTDGADPKELDPYEIQWAYVGDSYPDTDKVEEKINEILEPKFNCSINLIPMSWGEFTQKLNLMLSGDEQLDLVPIIGTSNGPTYLNNGQVLDIKDIAEKYAKDIPGVVGDDVFSVCTVGGKMYGVPVYKEYSYSVGVMMRKDLLEEAGFTTEDIKTMEDLDPVYAKVKEKHPEMIMLAGRKGGTPGADAHYYDELSDNFGVIMPGDTKGEVVNYFETEEFRTLANQLYDFAQKGYISKDCATMNDTRQAQVKAGTAFSYFTPLKPGVELQDSLDTGYEMVYSQLTDTFKCTSQEAWIGWGIGKNCKYPERVMETFNYMYTDAEVMNLLNWGIEGEHYQFVDKEKGIITYPDGVDAQSKKYGLNIGYEIPNQKIAYVWEGNDPSIWEKYEEFNSAEPMISTGFIFDNAAVSTEVSALSNVYNQYIDAIGSGAVEPDKAIEEFNDALYDAGLQTVMDEKQKQLDAFLAAESE